MANLKEQLKKGLAENSCPAICDLVAKVFTTRNLVHFAHWNTNSYAAHMALGDLYDGIVDEVDSIVECYQGEFGLLKGLCTEKAELPSDITAHIKAEMGWVQANQAKIANGSSSISNMLDNLVGKYQKTIYKLTNLH